jgi:sulfur transfer protein SufE
VSEAPFQRALDHVAPVARRVSDREEDGNLAFGGKSKGLVRPGPPVHGVLGVLEQVWAGRRSEAVAARHPLTLFVAARVSMRAQLNDQRCNQLRISCGTLALRMRRSL